MLTEGVWFGLTVITIALLDTVDGLAHASLFVSVHMTSSPLIKVLVPSEAVVSPASIPFTVHEYVGDAPGFTGVAVKITDAPSQMAVPWSERMLTEGITTSTTLTVIGELTAVEDVTHASALSIEQETTSPSASVDEEKVGELEPTEALFTSQK
jgi:hypothetical protein